MKVSVYAISRNEQQFVLRWLKSMGEADEIVVLDTGSTDDTVKMLKEGGAKVTEKVIEPWRFDVARNESLALVGKDTDICVCTDLDEELEPGWREKLERLWTKETQVALYRYTWSFCPDGSEGVVFWYGKIHARNGFRWKYPVHEILEYIGGKRYKEIQVEGIQLNHRPDETKPRSQYLPLLELSVQENPLDDRARHYLGREYMYYRRWQDCIDTLMIHLSMPSATWIDERSASMRYVAKSYSMLGNKEKAHSWFLRSMAEASHLREPFLDFASFCYDLQEWAGVWYGVSEALKITERPRSYMNEAESWGAMPYDLGGIALYHIGNKSLALVYAKRALELNMNNSRLRENVQIISQELGAL